MNYVFEKALLSQLFVQNHYFFAHVFFKSFIPTLYLHFCGRALESLLIRSLVLVQPRETLLDMTKIVDMDVNNKNKHNKWERSGSVVECLTRDREDAGSSLTVVTALCP